MSSINDDLPSVVSFVCDHCKKEKNKLILIDDPEHDYMSDKAAPQVCLDCKKVHDEVRECLFVLVSTLHTPSLR